MAETIKVVRDGPRGWHLISKQDFDPVKHVLWESEEEIAARKEAEKKAEEAAKLATKEAEEAAKLATKEAEKEAEKEAKRAATEAAKEAAKLNQPTQDK